MVSINRASAQGALEVGKIVRLVDEICGSTTTLPEHPDWDPDVPTRDTWDAAGELLRLVGVPIDEKNMHVYEVPLCWDRQVCVRFGIGEFGPDAVVFSLVAGISEDDGERTLFYEIDFEADDYPVPVQDGLLTLTSYSCGLDEEVPGARERPTIRADAETSRTAAGRFRAAVESLFPEKMANAILAHVNKVLTYDGVLVVYLDNMVCVADLDAHRELLRLRLWELFGEQPDELRFLLSKKEKYRRVHPYKLQAEEKHRP